MAKSAPPRAQPPPAARPAPGKPRSTARAAPRPAQLRFPIVGIGASAGGLAALELFFKYVPAGSPLAFVIIQHLDPTHPDQLVKLLQRYTALPVAQIRDRLRVKPGRVYVLPPNQDVSIRHGVLHLHPPPAPPGLRQPIDFFLRALADDQGEHSLGVILSGMGTDGTLGLRAIKAKGGAAFVQEPTSAEFDSMPRSALDAGLDAVVARAEDLPRHLNLYPAVAPPSAAGASGSAAKAPGALEQVIRLLRSQTGHDFSAYKPTTIYRRLERRMGLHQIDTLATYLEFLQAHPQELDVLFQELLISVTRFFRDPAAWEQVAHDVVRPLVAGGSAEQALRVWMPGCATGEEAYSLAILFQEAIEQVRPADAPPLTVQIFATDLDQAAIEKARASVYPPGIAPDVSAERLKRYFVLSGQGYRVTKAIREKVIFARHNVIADPPFTRLDLLVCRNLLIYLNGELQAKLLQLFHYCLNPGGYLWLGSTETVGGTDRLFAPPTGGARLFQRRETTLAEPVEFPTRAAVARPPTPATTAGMAATLQSLVDQLLLQRYAPAAVLTNDRGDIVYISGRTGKYLELAAGKANWNIFAMARPGLAHPLWAAFQSAVSDNAPVTLNNVAADPESGTTVQVTLQRLEAPEALHGLVMIVFTEVAPPPVARRGQPSARVVHLERELAQAHQALQTMQAALQQSLENLQSLNEQLQSTNEELQSTNEELMTSTEEQLSSHAELQAANQALQTKVDDLSLAQHDMNSLLEGANMAALFLDRGLHIRRFTSQAAKITQLIPGDVGRPITDIASGPLYADLAADVERVLHTLIWVEKQVTTRTGQVYAVRTLPNITAEKEIDGVVITLTDITPAPAAAAEVGARGSAPKASHAA